MSGASETGGEREGPGIGTVALHGRGGADDGPSGPARAHVPPLHQTTAFTFRSLESGTAIFRGDEEGWIYTRLSNPTVRELERRIADLEGMPVAAGPEGTLRAPEDLDSRFFASGMAALSAVAMGCGAGGGRIVCQEGIYGNTVHLVRRLSEFGMEVDFAPAGDAAALAEVVGRGRPPSLVHIETPANPLLQVTDVRAAARAAHEAGALLSVDATFATPALLRPLAWGADFSVHSTTKYISGHGVALGGVVTGRAALVKEKVEAQRRDFGGAPDPFAAWLTLLGLMTLELRVARASETAAALAALLHAHPSVDAVHHPDPADLPVGQMMRGGPMLSFELAGGEEAVRALVGRLRLVTVAPTLGTTDTLVQHPSSMSHAILPEEERRALGIGPGLLRVSVGIEETADLVADFERALGA